MFIAPTDMDDGTANGNEPKDGGRAAATAPGDDEERANNDGEAAPAAVAHLCPECKTPSPATDLVCEDCLDALAKITVEDESDAASMLARYQRIFDRSLDDANEAQFIRIVRLAFDRLDIPEIVPEEEQFEPVPSAEQLLDLIANTLAEFETATGRLAANPYTYLRMGIALILLRDSESASFFLDRAIHLDPSLAEVWFAKALILDRKGRFQEALRSFDRALQHNAEHWRAHFKKGMILDELGRFHEAIREYDRVLRLNPDFEPAWRRKGDICQQKQQYRQAEECFRKAEALSSGGAAPSSERGDAPAAPAEGTEMQGAMAETAQGDEYAAATPASAQVPALEQALSTFPQLQRKAVHEALDTAQLHKRIAVGLGIDTSAMSDTIDALPRLLMKRDITSTLSTLERQSDRLKEQVREKVIAALLKLSKAMESQQREIGSSPPKKWLHQAKKAHQEERFNDALEYIQRAHEELEEREREHERARRALQTVWSQLADARRRNVDTAMGEKLLSHARAAMRRGEFEKVFNLTENARSVTFTPQSTLVEDIRDALDELEETLLSLREEDVSVADARSIFNNARQAYEREDYNVAEQLISETKTAIKHARQAHNLQFITERTEELEEVIADLRKEGADTSALETQLTLLRGYLGDRKFAKSFEYLDMLESSLQTEHKQLKRNRLKELTEQLLDHLSDAENFGAEVASYYDQLTTARQHIRDDRLEDAYRLLTEMKAEVVKLRLDFFVQNMSVIVSELERDLRRLKKRGLERDAFAQQFKELKHAFSEGEYSTVLRQYKVLEYELQSAAESYYRTKTEQLLKTLRPRRKRFRGLDPTETGVDLDEIDTLLAQSGGYLDDREYESAYECAVRANELMDTVAESFSREKKETKEILQFAKNALKKMPEERLDLTRAKRLFKKARRAAQQHRYQTAITLARRSVAEIKDAGRHIKIINGLNSLRAFMIKMKDKGIDVSDAKREFSKAREYLLKRDYEPIFEILKRTKALVLKKQNEANRIREANAQRLEKLDATVATARALGAQTRRLDERVKKLMLHHKTNPYRDLRPYIDRYYAEAVELLDQRRAIRVLKEARQAIDELEAKGYDVRPSAQLLHQARKPLYDQDYDTAVEYARRSTRASEAIEGAIALEERLRSELLVEYLDAAPLDRLEALEEALDDAASTFATDPEASLERLEEASERVSSASQQTD